MNIVKRDLKKEHLKLIKRKRVFNKINYILFHHLDFVYFPIATIEFLKVFIFYDLLLTIVMLIDNTAFLPLVYNPLYLEFLIICFWFFVINTFVFLIVDIINSFRCV